MRRSIRMSWMPPRSRDCYALLKNFVENNGLADRLFEAAKVLVDQGKYNEAIPGAGGVSGREERL